MSIIDLAEKAEHQRRSLRRLGIIILASIAAISLLTNIVVGVIFYTTENHAGDQRANLIGQITDTRNQLNDSRHSVDVLSAETEALRKQLTEAGLKPVEVAPVPPTSVVPKRTTPTTRENKSQIASSTTTTNKPSNPTTTTTASTTSTTQPKSPPTTRCIVLTLGCGQET